MGKEAKILFLRRVALPQCVNLTQMISGFRYASPLRPFVHSPARLGLVPTTDYFFIVLRVVGLVRLAPARQTRRVS